MKMKETIIHVKGMVCGGCESRVKNQTDTLFNRHHKKAPKFRGFFFGQTVRSFLSEALFFMGESNEDN